MRRLMAVAGAALLIGVAGCGGGDDNSSNENTGTAASPAGNATETINVSETDFKLDPANPRVSKPGVVEIKATNDGQTTHSLEVEGPGEEQQLKSDLQPGDSGTIKVDLSKAGRYEWYCPIANHRQLGMEGEIVVGGSGGSSTTSTGGTQTSTNETSTNEDSGGSGSGGGSSGSGGGGGY
jgi:plastocyanin